jgi:hypothetical protein
MTIMITTINNKKINCFLLEVREINLRALCRGGMQYS